MEFALRQRLRAAEAVSDLAGTVGGEAAIDIGERKSNNVSAFPAVVQTVVEPGRIYNQSRRQGTRKGLFRYEVFGLNADSTLLLAEAIADELEAEPEASIAGVRFQRGIIFAGPRNGGVEALGDLTIHRRILDMEITTKT
ncbi:hypothetical protein [Alteriqipengyuania sp.]|uniref:hypothetical protein n=1 Tax=Alteriqipengyuania sp. TaxID=2800692 RepID=UPI0035133947